MKHLSKLSSLIALLLVMLVSCKEDDDPKPSSAKEFASFKFLATQNQGLPQDVQGVITGNGVTLKISNAADIKKLIPTFETTDAKTIVTVNNVAQISGVNELDFTNPVTYMITAEDNSTQNYTVSVVRNASIVEFGFYAADNPGVLFKDYVATITGLNVALNVPADANIANLAARFTTTSGATVKVNGTNQVSGTTKNNFTTAVQYNVADADGSENYTVTVGRLTAPEWVVIGTEAITAARPDWITMAINPTTNLPYIAYQTDGTGVVDADKKVAVVKYNGTGSSWEHLGPSTGFSDTRAENIALAFSKTGTPYVAYKDYLTTTLAATVQAYNGTSWAPVGNKTFTNRVDNYLSLGLDKDNVPYIAYSDRSNLGGIPNRGLNIYKFNNSWASATISGVLTSHTQLVRKGDDFYLAIMERTGSSNKPSVYKLTNGTWASVGTPQFSGNNNQNGFIKVDLAVANDGKIYLAYQDAITTGQRKNIVMQYNGTSWAPIGDPIIVGSESDNFNIAVHPDGRVFLGYVDATGLYVRTFNTNTNNWNPPVTVAGPADDFDMGISDVGIPYLAASIDATEKIRVWKYDIP